MFWLRTVLLWHHCRWNLASDIRLPELFKMDDATVVGGQLNYSYSATKSLIISIHLLENFVWGTALANLVHAPT